jgi:hypothetical protein
MPNAQTATETVLVVSPSLNRTAALSGMLESGYSPVAIMHSPNCEQASRHLTDSRVSVVICEALVPDGSWEDLLARMMLSNNAVGQSDYSRFRRWNLGNILAHSWP